MSKGWALVTGASSGLGVALARELAERGYDIVLAARTSAPMHELAAKLSRDHGADVEVEAIDLSHPGSAGDLVARLDAKGIAPEILVNNAGFGLSEDFIAHDPQALRNMLNLNIVSLTELSHLLGGRMAQRGSGYILFVASLAAYAPSPGFAAYAASKAYILSLGEALHAELAPDVGVTVLSPGLMDTGFNSASGFVTSAKLQRLVRPVDMVARIGIDAMFARVPSKVAGKLNRAMVAIGGLLPRHFALRRRLKSKG